MAGRHRASLRPACSTTHQQPRSPGSSLTSCHAAPRTVAPGCTAATSSAPCRARR